jgi:hypothetical protein
MTGTLFLAEQYLGRGLSIIPIQPGTKKPAVPSWTEYQRRRATPDEVLEWFGNDETIGVGIVLGSVSGVVALDDDVSEYTAATTFDTAPLATPTVKTGRGGFHRFLEWREGLPNRFDICPGVTLRGEGHYVVAPPSIHPNGTPYSWLIGFDVPVLSIDDAGINLDGARRPETRGNGDSPFTKWARELAGETYEPGRRHDALLAFAAGLPSRGMDEDEIFETLLIRDRSRNRPPIQDEPDRDWEKELRDIARYVVETNDALPVLVGAGAPEGVAPAGSAARVVEELELRRFDPNEKREPTRYHFDPIIPVGANIFFLGKEGSSKTAAARHLAFEAAFAGIRVVYFSEDMPPDRDAVFYHRFLQGFGRVTRDAPEALVWFTRQGVDVSEKQGRQAIARTIKKERADIVIFDAYNSVFAGRMADKGYENWNASAAYSALLQDLRAQSPETALVTICHPPESDEFRLPGGSALPAIADLRVQFRGTYGGGDVARFTMTNSKQTRYPGFTYDGEVRGPEGEDFAPLRVTLRPKGETRPARPGQGGGKQWNGSSGSSHTGDSLTPGKVRPPTGGAPASTTTIGPAPRRSGRGSTASA